MLIDDGRESLHYREWFDLLAGRGLRDRGQGPARCLPHPDHPLPGGPQGRPRRGLRARPGGAARLRTTIDRLQRELRELTTTTEMTAADLNAIRARRTQLTAEIGRAERRLEEVARVFERTRALVAASA